MAHEHLKGSVEAQLDRLKARTQRATDWVDVNNALKGTLDLLRDVLLEEKPDGKR